MRLPEQTLNRIKVLKAIRRHAPLSRSDLPAHTGLSGGTISQVTADLVRRGFLIETKEKAKQRTGRPRINLKINSGATVVVGAGFTDTGRLEAAFVDLAGNRLFGTEIPMSPSATLVELAKELTRALRTAISASPFEPNDIGRAGVALPAVVDSCRGIVHFIGTFPPEAVPFAAIVGGELGLRATIENDMGCMARAEHWFGRAQELDTFTLIYVGLLVSSAEYIDGLPRVGANGFNPEFGHTKTAVGEDAPRCYCGGRGCLTTISSIYGMLRASGLPEQLDADAIGGMHGAFRHLLDQADAGDADALMILDRAAMHLGIGIANHVNATDPGRVLVLCEGQRLRQRLVDRALEVVEENTFAGILRGTTIVFDTVDTEWRWKGAAALALEKLYLDEEVTGAADDQITVGS